MLGAGQGSQSQGPGAGQGGRGGQKPARAVVGTWSRAGQSLGTEGGQV